MTYKGYIETHMSKYGNKVHTIQTSNEVEDQHAQVFHHPLAQPQMNYNAHTK